MEGEYNFLNFRLEFNRPIQFLLITKIVIIIYYIPMINRYKIIYNILNIIIIIFSVFVLFTYKKYICFTKN